ncbi:MAG: tRNA (N6-threonylcarbamoyladenosine(37)-N6)-methyltransferase TrmO [Marinagarivorans sp.]|nr:tRNA (N6-threonylcarbamoyladenosine(37)-N6)-methyltransferase TrmO [Marinagarivorans sp.]
MDFPTVNFSIIGVVSSCFKEKFGIPRQPGLVKSSSAVIELLSPYNNVDAVDGLELTSHIWVHFLFHANAGRDWKAKVRPPRLGGNASMGVFATRSPIRPNPLGLSVVRLQNVVVQKKMRGMSVQLHIAEHDLLDGTPVLDIKPYIPYADSLPYAVNGFAGTEPKQYAVVFSISAQAVCASARAIALQLQSLIVQVLAQDPRPAYQKNDSNKLYGVRLHDWNVRWRVEVLQGEQYMFVEVIETLAEPL